MLDQQKQASSRKCIIIKKSESLIVGKHGELEYIKQKKM